MSTYFTLGNYFFGAVQLSKNVNLDKYRYSGYGIGFDARSNLSIKREFAKIIIFCGLDNSS